jgi:hypothetical protein
MTQRVSSRSPTALKRPTKTDMSKDSEGTDNFMLTIWNHDRGNNHVPVTRRVTQKDRTLARVCTWKLLGRPPNHDVTWTSQFYVSHIRRWVTDEAVSRCITECTGILFCRPSQDGNSTLTLHSICGRILQFLLEAFSNTMGVSHSVKMD